jgi:hypothetical protein
MNSFRSFLYLLAKLKGDINAVQKVRVGLQVGQRLVVKSAWQTIRKISNKIRFA